MVCGWVAYSEPNLVHGCQSMAHNLEDALAEVDEVVVRLLILKMEYYINL